MSTPTPAPLIAMVASLAACTPREEVARSDAAPTVVTLTATDYAFEGHPTPSRRGSPASAW